jgi:hypothetical protein
MNHDDAHAALSAAKKERTDASTTLAAGAVNAACDAANLDVLVEQ